MMNKSYFQHNNNSFNHFMIQKVVFHYGIEGYGVYFSLLETMHKEGGKIKLSDIKKIAQSMREEEEKIKEIIFFMIGIDLFKTDGEYFYSERLLEEMEGKE